MVTIKEIAEIAGVHRSTVDKVLHNRPGVSPVVRLKIQKLINELGYRPNPLGLALQKKQQKITLAAVMLQVDALDSIRRGIEHACTDYSAYELEILYRIFPYGDTELQAAAIHALIDQHVDGILLRARDTPEICAAINRAEASGIPVIAVNSDVTSSARTCFVGQDCYQAGRIAACLMGEFLNDAGNILLITDRLDDLEQSTSSNLRYLGFQSILTEQYPDIHIVSNIESHEDPFYLFEQTSTLLQQNPDIDAIYITCGGVNEVGRALHMTAKSRKIRLICFENYPEIIDLMQKRIVTCTLDSDLEQQGYLPCQLLMNKILYKKEPTSQYAYTTTRILVRADADPQKKYL